MRGFKAFWTGTGTATLVMALAGCDAGGGVQDSSGAGSSIGAKGITDSSQFDRELIAAKKGNTDPALRERAMEAVLDKYGVAYPKANPWLSQAGPEAADGLAASGPATAKSAAAAFSALRRDITASYDIQTISDLQWVGAGKTLTITVTGNNANVDPFLVAYTADGLPPAQVIRVVAYNDDVSGVNRNSMITWTNNTGSTQNVFWVAFAYSSATRGQAFIQVTANGGSETFANAAIGGLHQYGASALPAEPDNCYPNRTRISLQQTSGTRLGYALVVDTKMMKGGLLSTDGAGQTHQIDLPWIVDNPYPSFALIFRPTVPVVNDASWRFIQRDIYSCVN